MVEFIYRRLLDFQVADALFLRALEFPYTPVPGCNILFRIGQLGLIAATYLLPEFNLGGNESKGRTRQDTVALGPRFGKFEVSGIMTTHHMAKSVLAFKDKRHGLS
jgi:hypothetical protein